MQVIYTIGPSDDATSRVRRAAMSKVPFGAHSVNSRTASNNGTNMKALMLNKAQLGESETLTIVASAISSILFAIIILAIFIIIIGKRRRRRREDVKVEKYNNSLDGDLQSQNNKDSEVEMNLRKTVRVSALNINKPDNLNRPEVKVKQVNLKVKDHTDKPGGGTEV